MVFIEPLNLKYILVNTFSGTLNIFIFIALLFIAMLAGRFRMPNTIALMMIALFGILFANYVNGVYAFVIIIGGLVGFFGIGRLFARG